MSRLHRVNGIEVLLNVLSSRGLWYRGTVECVVFTGLMV